MLAGTQGVKFPAIRQHLDHVIAQVYADLDVAVETYPDDHVARDEAAYIEALNGMRRGDVVTIFTPDDTHCRLALAAVERGCHVLIAKPLVKTVAEHLELFEAAEAADVLVAMEVHKRWDPIYSDARDQIRRLGEFSHFQSYMSQPKQQLETFRAWAGKSSDISFYLNAHHVDFHSWSMGDRARPIRVVASAGGGFATSHDVPTEDVISLMVTWENCRTGNPGCAIYTAAWIAPRSDVHSQQRFFYLGHEGEITVDQAHRGYTIATDKTGLVAKNPLFMKYAPDARRRFCGQQGYGYRSIEDFVLAAKAIRARERRPRDFRGELATVADTLYTTAILEAGRRSLDGGGIPIEIDPASHQLAAQL